HLAYRHRLRRARAGRTPRRRSQTSDTPACSPALRPLSERGLDGVIHLVADVPERAQVSYLWLLGHRNPAKQSQDGGAPVLYERVEKQGTPRVAELRRARRERNLSRRRLREHGRRAVFHRHLKRRRIPRVVDRTEQHAVLAVAGHYVLGRLVEGGDL